MHTYNEEQWWVKTLKFSSAPADEYHINLFLTTTIDPTVGRHVSSWCIELPTENFTSAISVQLTAIAYAGYNDSVGKIEYTFNDLLPHPFNTVKHTVAAFTQCIDLQVIDDALVLGKNVCTYTKYDHSYLSSMTDDQILQHAISYGDNRDVRCAIDHQLSLRGKRVKSFIDGSIDKIVPISKPKVKVKVGLSKSEFNAQKRMLQARFRHKLQKWTGSPDIEVNNWASSQTADEIKNNKKFLKDVGWSINTLLEYEVVGENEFRVSFNKLDPKDYPELIVWWDSITLD